MKEMRITDVTMKRSATAKEPTLTFKEKLELAKLLDNLGVSIVEVEGIEKPKADALRIKSIASLVKDCVVAVPVKLDGSDVEAVWNALAEAKKPRLQVQAATSPARMEYIHKKKAPKMIEIVAAAVAACAAHTADVEFIAEDATRTETAYLKQIIEAAIDAGATTITVCDDAGTMLPEEFAQFIRGLKEEIPALATVSLGVSCSDALFMAEPNAIAAIAEGADELKATAYPMDVVSLPKITKILSDKGETCDATHAIRTATMKRIITQIERICEQGRPGTSLFADVTSDEETNMVLTQHDTLEAVSECVVKLGYDLSPEDLVLVYEAFQRIATKKDSIDGRELDAIVASAAMQVPATYKLLRYTINSGNLIRSTAYIQMQIGEETVEQVGMGDGPIDAAFAAIEKIVGKRYELEDWQMKSVTQGQESMGEAVIKLTNEGKMYSGRGISTDITGSSIRAYVNALNKIVFEEEN